MDLLNSVGLAWGNFSPTTRIFLAISVLAILALLGDVLYNLYFCPLASFPGPRLCAISRIPHLIATVRGKQVPWYIKLHNKYGGVVRIAPDILTFTDERAWNDICGSTKYAQYGMIKDPSLASMIGGDLTNPDPAKPRRQQAHTVMRRAMLSALKGANVRKLEGMIDGHVQEYLAALESNSSIHGAVDICDMSSFLMGNLFFDLFLGESLDLFKKDTFHPWIHSFDRFSRGVTILAVLNRFPMLHAPLLYAVKRWGGKERDSFMQPILSRFDRRVAMTTPRDDMLEMVLDGDNKQNTMPLDLLREFSPFLLLGGCDPMPSVIAAFVYFVFRDQNTAIRQRLLKEIRGNFKSEQDITMDRLSKSSTELPYFEACLQESFRCYSPGATGTDRVVPGSGARVADRDVPGGTVVIMLHQPSYSLDEHFARPNEFIPERWLSEDAGRPKEFEHDRRSCVHPFSVGPQACFGQE
uniref:CapE n=1 Tax=Capnodium sp. TTI-000886 TaxID=3078996 RepID=A0AA96MLM2_9PEZI|nr:CapE [Capnodium sp. TTI-000886]